MNTFHITLRALYAILLFGLVFGTSSCADKIDTPTSGSNAGLIVYTKYDNGFLASVPGALEIDSSGIVKNSITDAATPSIVRDAQGGKILYSTGLTDPTQTTMKLIVANNDNSAQHVVYAATATQDLQLISPVLSQDGSLVAYATVDSGATNSNLWVSKTDGTLRHLITAQFNNLSTPCFSEDGKKIVYYTSTYINQFLGQGTLEVTNVDMTGTNTICSVTLPGTAGAGTISWKHGTNQIAYFDNGTVNIIDISGSGKQSIDNGGTPMWSPDGSQLAYSGADLDIYLTSDLGLTKTNITNTTATSEAYPQWSSDGKEILCLSWTGDFNHNTQSLELIEASGTHGSKILATPAIFGYFLK